MSTAKTPEADMFEMARNALSLLHDETSTAYRAVDGGPAAGSLAADELTNSPGRVMVQTAYSQGALLLEVTADHALACSKTLSNPVQSVAPWTGARSALETSALGCWLMDTSVDARMRVQRSFAFRYEGLQQQEKYFRAAGETVVADAVVMRVNEVEQKALALGYAPVRDKRGRCIAIGQQMPTVTQIIRDALDREEFYRLLSGVAHAHFWALNKLSLTRSFTSPPSAIGRSDFDPNGVYLEKALSGTSITALAF